MHAMYIAHDSVQTVHVTVHRSADDVHADYKGRSVEVLYQGKGKGDDETRSGDEQVRIHITHTDIKTDTVFTSLVLRILSLLLSV